jgi:hypothetical protein
MKIPKEKDNNNDNNNSDKIKWQKKIWDRIGIFLFQILIQNLLLDKL